MQNHKNEVDLYEWKGKECQDILLVKKKINRIMISYIKKTQKGSHTK